MQFFKPAVARQRWHPNFRHVMARGREPERALFERWAEGFVDRDGKVVEEFQLTFNSSFWEVYIFAALKEYGYKIDWSHRSPDFVVTAGDSTFCIEAVTASTAQGKPNEWDVEYSLEELERLKRFKELNTEAIVRLSNSIVRKSKKYRATYAKHEWVNGRPFVLAIAPFEQPHFNLQYDRPIRALLYDYYVDEDKLLDNPQAYPDGPPAVQLGSVRKQNGAKIDLGLFCSPRAPEISAVIFSCTATWGKLSAMSHGPRVHAIVNSLWATPPNGTAEHRQCKREDHEEEVLDGLQVYHNPFAAVPLSPTIFRWPRVVQHYKDPGTGEWCYESRTNALQWRNVMAIRM